jgi:hypothetical protein
MLKSGSVPLRSRSGTFSKLAVDGQIEQGQIAGTFRKLSPDPNSPDLPKLEWGLRSDQAVLVPGDMADGSIGTALIAGHGMFPPVG